jgi:hypothetical protein
MKKIQYYLPVFCVLSLLLMSSLSVKAQAADPEQANETPWIKKTTANIDLFTEIDVEYSDNVFRLTESQQANMDENVQEDIGSHRFDDMDAVSDYILSPVIGFRYKSDSPIHGKLRLDASGRYHWYNDNKEHSYPEFEIQLENSVGDNGVLSIEGNFTFDFFKRNYLSGFNNVNGNGNITRDERIYDSAVYDEYEGIISYEHEFLNNRGEALSEIDIEPFAGYSSRYYNSPFGNRDRNITLGGIAVSLEFFSKIDLELAYRFEKVDAPNFRELVLFDEVSSLTDANGDGDLYRNAPLVTRIDRSAERNTVEVEASIELTKNTLLNLGYRDRVSTYSSDNPLDIEHYNKKAYRERFRSGIEYEFSKFLSFEFRYTRTSDDDEDGEYIENCYLFTIKAKKSLDPWGIF